MLDLWHRDLNIELGLLWGLDLEVLFRYWILDLHLESKWVMDSKFKLDLQWDSGFRLWISIVLWNLDLEFDLDSTFGLTLGLRHTTWGRSLYALGGGRTASARLLISERAYWIGVYTISGLFSALTGSLLLGWSGGGFIGVGDQYLFMTLAAVVVGGTSLLGGWGGYGFTVIGVLVLQVLTSFLVGIGLSYEGQQFVFGLLILPMVALYARSPHIRTQI